MIRQSGILWTYCSTLLNPKIATVAVFPQLYPMRFLFTNEKVYKESRNNKENDESVFSQRVRALVKDLNCIYSCSGEEVEKMLELHRPLLQENVKNIISNAEILKANGLTKSTLVTNPWVLTYNSKHFPYMIKLLKTGHKDINDSLPLLEIPRPKLLRVLTNISKENNFTLRKSKIEWLSEQLECDVFELSQILVKHYKVLRLPRDRILKVLNILKEGGVSLKDVKNDMYIFQHNTDVMEERLSEAKEKGVNSLKPWSLRSPEETFKTTLERKVKAREFLGDHKTVKEYVAARLHCTENDVSTIFRKIPQLRHITVLKVKELLDYLFSMNYTPSDVFSTERILTRSVTTLKKRIEELQHLGISHPNLSMLCKSEREYNDFLTKLKHVHGS